MAHVAERWSGVRRASGALCLALALVLTVSAARAPTVLADVITTPGPLTRIEVTPTLGCAVNHVADAEGEFYPGTPASSSACGTFVAVGGFIYGPDPATLPGATALTSLPNYRTFTPVGQTTEGTGTAADPYRIVTTVTADGLVITQTDTYIVGQESYRTDVTVSNVSATGPITVYRAGDCNLQNDDTGFGLIDPATGSVACVNANAAGTGPGNRIIQWRPITPGSHFIEARPSEVWAAIATGFPFPDTCRCAERIDNAAGLSWAATIPQGSAQTFSHITLFSPTGQQVLTVMKAADAATVPAGGTTGYTITITNPTNQNVIVNSITDTLPSGFTYVPGSTTGLTPNDPTTNGQTLTWAGPFVIPPNSSVTLHFNVVAPANQGTFFNSASANAGAFTVVPTGNVAPIQVGAAQVTTTTTTTTTPSSTTSTTTAASTTSTTAGGGNGSTTSTTATNGSTTTTTATDGSTTTTTTTGGTTTTSTTAGTGSGTTTTAGAGGAGGGGTGSGTGSGSGGGGGGGAATTTTRAGNPLARTGDIAGDTASAAAAALAVGGLLLLAGGERPAAGRPSQAQSRPGGPRRGTWTP